MDKEKLLYEIMEELEDEKYSYTCECCDCSSNYKQFNDYIERLKAEFNFDYYDYQEKERKREEEALAEKRKNVKVETPRPIKPIKDVPCKSCGKYVYIESEYDLCVRCIDIMNQKLSEIEKLKQNIKKVLNNHFDVSVNQHSEKISIRAISKEEKNEEIIAIQNQIFNTYEYLINNNLTK